MCRYMHAHLGKMGSGYKLNIKYSDSYFSFLGIFYFSKKTHLYISLGVKKKSLLYKKHPALRYSNLK